LFLATDLPFDEAAKHLPIALYVNVTYDAALRRGENTSPNVRILDSIAFY